MMAWVEQGIEPKPSSRFTFELPLTQVILPESAKKRKGLQPVIGLTANGSVDRAEVGVNQPVTLVAKIQMPPSAGKVTQFNWTFGSANEAPTILEEPNQLVEVNRTVSFATAGNYVVRLNVNGQRDGDNAPLDQTLEQNFKEVRVVVQ
jgi:hypothetical protein